MLCHTKTRPLNYLSHSEDDSLLLFVVVCFFLLGFVHFNNRKALSKHKKHLAALCESARIVSVAGNKDCEESRFLPSCVIWYFWYFAICFCWLYTILKMHTMCRGGVEVTRIYPQEKRSVPGNLESRSTKSTGNWSLLYTLFSGFLICFSIFVGRPRNWAEIVHWISTQTVFKGK